MNNRLIGIFILVVVGLALLPVLADFQDTLVEGQEVEYTEKTATDTDTTFDFDVTDENLQDATITINDELLVDEGEAETDVTYDFDDSESGVYYLENDTGHSLTIDPDDDSIAFEDSTDDGAWEDSGDTVIEYTELEDAVDGPTATLVELVPVIYVIVLVTGVVAYVKFK